MAKKTDFVNEALKYVGYKGDIFKKWYGLDDEWCAIFVSYIASAAGILGKLVYKTAGAGDFARQGVKKGWGKWYEAKYQGGTVSPQAGDIVTFTWNGLSRYSGQDAYFSDHVGIVYAADKNYVYTIEGNTGTNNNKTSTVMKKYYKLDSGFINGYFRPDWSKVDRTNEPEMPSAKPSNDSKTVKMKNPVTVTGKTSYLRADGRVDAKVLATAKVKEKLDFIEDDAYGWSKVKNADGVTGWIQNSRITGRAGLTTWRFGTFTGTGVVNVRQSKSTSSMIVTTIKPKGTFIIVDWEKDNIGNEWMRVSVPVNEINKDLFIFYDRSYISVGGKRFK